MKYLSFCFLFTASLFADSFTLDNKTSFQNISIKWASSARMAQESNESLMQGDAISQSKLYSLSRTQSKIAIPKNGAYFRVLIWTAKGKLPDLLTNWVDVVPDKTYLLTDEHLTPILLMNGIGC